MEAEKKPFDLASLAASDEADLHILDSSGAKIGWTWTFAGPAHPVTIAADNANNARYIAREDSKERAQTNGRKWKGDGEAPDDKAARLRQESIDYMAARLLRWSDMTMDGAPFPCTPDNARKILADRRFGLVYDQANAFLIDEKSFMKRSPKV